MKKLISFVLTFLIVISSLSGLNTVVFATDSNTITLGSAVTVTEDSVTYTFTTEKAGAYVMYSQGEGCLCALLYNSDGNTITSEFQNAEDGRGFYIEKVLGANSTYSIEVYNRYPEEVPTDYELNVEKLESDGALAVGTEAKINKKEAYHTFTPTVSGYYYFYTTGTCDTYGELYDSANMSGGLLDVYTGYPKAMAIELATRTMNPECLICDELGTADETDALLDVQNTGVPLIASTHASDIAGMLRRPNIRRLHDARVFELYVLLKRRGNSFEFRFVKPEEADG